MGQFMSYVFPVAHSRARRPSGLSRLIAQKDGLQLELRVIPSGAAPNPACNRWLAATFDHVDRWIDIANASTPLAVLLLVSDHQHDMEALMQLREWEPDATIFAVAANNDPLEIARLLSAGADDVWHFAMPAAEAWARLIAAVRRRTLAST